MWYVKWASQTVNVLWSSYRLIKDYAEVADGFGDGYELEPILSEISGNLLMLYHEPAMKNSVFESFNFK